MATKKASGLISVRAYCKDCDWTNETGAAGLQATRHHQDTNHHIRVEQTTFWERYVEDGGTATKAKKRKKRTTKRRTKKK